MARIEEQAHEVVMRNGRMYLYTRIPRDSRTAELDSKRIIDAGTVTSSVYQGRPGTHARKVRAGSRLA
jgi:hypothetical protein